MKSKIHQITSIPIFLLTFLNLNLLAKAEMADKDGEASLERLLFTVPDRDTETQNNTANEDGSGVNFVEAREFSIEAERELSTVNDVFTFSRDIGFGMRIPICRAVMHNNSEALHTINRELISSEYGESTLNEYIENEPRSGCRALYIYRFRVAEALGVDVSEY